MSKAFLVSLVILSLAGVSGAQGLDERRINNPSVAYVSPGKLRRFPTPALIYLHDRAQYDTLKEKITEQVIYPLIRASSKPIAAFVVDFCPDIVETTAADRRGCEEDRGNLVLGVTIKWWNGSNFLLMIERNSEGSFDIDEHLDILPRSYIQRRTPTPLTKLKVTRSHRLRR